VAFLSHLRVSAAYTLSVAPSSGPASLLTTPETVCIPASAMSTVVDSLTVTTVAASNEAPPCHRLAYPDSSGLTYSLYSPAGRSATE
jgi:hypothetical protein